MKELVDQIKAEYEVFAKNADAQVEKGNKAAGARARKAALNLMKAMKEFRKQSNEATKYISFRERERPSRWGGFYCKKKKGTRTSLLSGPSTCTKT